MNLKDVNFEIDGAKWEEAILNYLKQNGFNDIGFEYGVGNWVTVFNK